MLSNAYFLAKFRFDTAENEPAKNLQNLPILLILLTLTTVKRPGPGPRRPHRLLPLLPGRAAVPAVLGGRAAEHGRDLSSGIAR